MSAPYGTAGCRCWYWDVEYPLADEDCWGWEANPDCPVHGAAAPTEGPLTPGPTPTATPSPSADTPCDPRRCRVHCPPPYARCDHGYCDCQGGPGITTEQKETGVLATIRRWSRRGFLRCWNSLGF